MGPSDEELAARFRGGDGDALRLLLERHGAAIEARVAVRLPHYLRRRLAVSDILQETRIDSPETHSKAIFIADPDGTLIELVQQPGD